MSSGAKKSPKLLLIIGGIVLGAVLLACVGCLALSAIMGSSPEYQATSTARAIARATEAARPSDTPKPSSTPKPTDTPAPTNTPTTTPTPKPTDTPAPTNTPTTTPTPKPTNTPAPTNTPTLPPVGTSRDNPVPAGTAVDIGDDRVLTIVGAVRPADDIVRRANMFNTEPEAGQEYLQVSIQVVCNKPPAQKCLFLASEIKAVGADGNIREAEWFIAGVDGLLESGEFFGGATRTGKMFFIVDKGDESVVLFYDPWLFGSDIYLALP